MKRKSPSTLHFKTSKGYKKWLAYGHIHGDFERVPGSKKIVIAGKPHHVLHGSHHHNKKFGGVF